MLTTGLLREAQAVAENSLTLLRNAGGLLPLDPARATRALFGEVAFRGRLPVRVPGLFELGAGIQLGAIRKP